MDNIRTFFEAWTEVGSDGQLAVRRRRTRIQYVTEPPNRT